MSNPPATLSYDSTTRPAIFSRTIRIVLMVWAVALVIGALAALGLVLSMNSRINVPAEYLWLRAMFAVASTYIVIAVSIGLKKSSPTWIASASIVWIVVNFAEFFFLGSGLWLRFAYRIAWTLSEAAIPVLALLLWRLQNHFRKVVWFTLMFWTVATFAKDALGRMVHRQLTAIGGPPNTENALELAQKVMPLVGLAVMLVGLALHKLPIGRWLVVIGSLVMLALGMVSIGYSSYSLTLSPERAYNLFGNISETARATEAACPPLLGLLVFWPKKSKLPGEGQQLPD